MDRYTERLVQGHPGPEAKLTLAAGILLCLGAVGVAVYGIISGSMIALAGLPVLVLGIYVAFYSRQLFSVEFEYLITNGDIEVSKIIAKKSRKVVREIRAEDIKKMAPLAKDSVRNDVDRTDKKRVFDYTAGDRGDYYVAYESLKGTECLYILDLEGESLQLMKDVLKSAFEK